MGIFSSEKNTENDTAVVGADTRATASMEAKEGLAKRRGRGRPPKSESTASSGDASRVDAASADLAKLFDPSVWQPLVTMPADAMLAITGHEFWTVQDKEAKALAASAASAAQYVGIENPRNLAISLFLVNLIFVYGTRSLKEFSIARAERETASKVK